VHSVGSNRNHNATTSTIILIIWQTLKIFCGCGISVYYYTIFDESLRKHDILYVFSQFLEVRSTMTTWYGHYRRHRRVTSIIMYRYIVYMFIGLQTRWIVRNSVFSSRTRTIVSTVQRSIIQAHIYFIRWRW